MLATALCGCGRDKEESPSESVSEPVASSEASAAESESTESAPTAETSSETESAESATTAETTSEAENTPADSRVTEPKTDTPAILGKYANDMFEYEYDANIGGMRITKYIGKLPDVVIPSTLDGEPVKAVGEYAFKNEDETACQITSVTIPEGVTSLGDGAFRRCKNLSSVVIGDGVTKIGRNTFFGCTSLSELTLGKNVSAIDDEAIEMCDGLTTITVDKNNKTYCSKDGVLYNKKMTELIQLVEKIHFARVCGQNGLFQQTEAAEAFGGFVMLFNREAP